mmetsp:Transcript_10223/g.21439  ORF Transcript_10223/g.21439 Transcript_10223/m.21439 type:complete len:216 (+) Transcript_10223:103-750(+)|eukprot:CAMPEP_0185850100 /NCGR_PEP_ID=MMETSP1354-20130828/4361_1 /TAXON_ID=708628 /ORGANISM="Erythrolobus madagascarensis, Strain CCMP3276" /LENGTH=215 /DNA_ID=CAMNT_0028550737 /DNA_START=91 /DNA_END=738 /DNA_ORIENTATION=+
MESTPHTKDNLERVAIRNLLNDTNCRIPQPPQAAASVRHGEHRSAGALVTKSNINRSLSSDADRDAEPSPQSQDDPNHQQPVQTSASNTTPSQKRRGLAWSWSEEEDLLLLSLVKKYGAASWSRYASENFGGRRTGSALRSRYFNNLIPGRDPDRPWSAEEDAVLLQKQREIGNNWVTIASDLPGRSGNDVKNRFHVLSRAATLRGESSERAHSE